MVMIRNDYYSSCEPSDVKYHTGIFVGEGLPFGL